MKIASSAFKSGQRIPTKYTCDGTDVNPPLEITDIPNNAKTMALIVDDPDAPHGTWTHWIVFNMPLTPQILEKNVPGAEAMNDFKKTTYGGPCPPSGTHRYFFKLYALDVTLALQPGASRTEVENAMKGHVIATAELMGTYSR